MVTWGRVSGLALTVKTYGFRTSRNSSPDSVDSDLGVSGPALTVKTYDFRTIWNSSPDSLDSLNQVSATAGQTLPTHAQEGKDDVSLTSN